MFKIGSGGRRQDAGAKADPGGALKPLPEKGFDDAADHAAAGVATGAVTTTSGQSGDPPGQLRSDQGEPEESAASCFPHEEEDEDAGEEISELYNGTRTLGQEVSFRWSDHLSAKHTSLALDHAGAKARLVSKDFLHFGINDL